jgi:hypothetical protein
MLPASLMRWTCAGAPGVNAHNGRPRRQRSVDNVGMVLSANEESLIKVVRALPPEEASKVLGWAQQLADLGCERAIEWSDSWSEEDLAEATAASLKRFDDQESESR